jgi:hypothetical protein
MRSGIFPKVLRISVAETCAMAGAGMGDYAQNPLLGKNFTVLRETSVPSAEKSAKHGRSVPRTDGFPDLPVPISLNTQLSFTISEDAL